MSDPLSTFTVVGSDRRIDAREARVVVAGYTGADRRAVQHHIDELAAIGIPPPERVPAFYPMPPGLATQDSVVPVSGEHTSGEVEPVLIRVGGELFLTVGSDHTDRDLERESIAGSKAACPKPLSQFVIPISGRALVAEKIAIRSTVDGEPYQDGTLATLRPLTDVLTEADDVLGLAGDDVVMFGGTVPLLFGSFRWGTRWGLALDARDLGSLEHTYKVERYVPGPNKRGG